MLPQMREHDIEKVADGQEHAVPVPLVPRARPAQIQPATIRVLIEDEHPHVAVRIRSRRRAVLCQAPPGPLPLEYSRDCIVFGIAIP